MREKHSYSVFSTISVLIVIFLIFSIPNSLYPQELFTSINEAHLSTKQHHVLSEIKKKPTTKDTRIVKIDIESLLEDSAINLKFITGLDITAYKTKIKKQSVHHFTWHATIPKMKSDIMLSVYKDAVVGYFVIDKKFYDINALGDGINAITEVDPTKYSNCGNLKDLVYEDINMGSAQDHEDSLVFNQEKTYLSSISINEVGKTTSLTKIRVFVAYTTLAKTQAGGENAMNALIFGAIASAEEAFDNSEIYIDLELASTEEFNYTATSIVNSYTDIWCLDSGKRRITLEKFRDTGDQVMDDIHKLRDAYAADICALITSSYIGDISGQAYEIDIVDDTDAFFIVKHSSANATAKWSFAHEIAHLLGGRHQRQKDPSGGPYYDDCYVPLDYAHGFYEETNDYRTMMNTGYNGTRIKYYSNPFKTVDGEQIGTWAYENVARALNYNASGISNFRQNHVINGLIYLNHDLIIEAGRTLTINAGSQVYLAPGVDIKIYGTLNAQGTPSNPITFDRSGSTGTWDGIDICSTGEAVFEYCTIKNAYFAIDAMNCGIINVEHSNFIDCPSAITAGGLTYIDLYGCQINNYINWGSYSDPGSSINAYANLITGGDYGMVNYGDITFSLGCLSENYIALINTDGAWANLGEEFEENGLNTIVCNNFDIETYEDILAQENFWGGDEPDNFIGYGDVDYMPYLEEDDPGNPYGDGNCSSMAKSISSNSTELDTTVNPKFTPVAYKLYKQAMKNFRKKSYSEAKTGFESILSNHSDSFFANFALQKLLLLKIETGEKDDILSIISTYEKNINIELAEYSNKMNILALRKLGQSEQALSLITEYSAASESALDKSFYKYQEAIIYKYDLQNEEQAKVSFNEYLQQFPDDDRNKLVLAQLNELSPSDLIYEDSEQNNQDSRSTTIPETFELEAAYPNPFNPSTTFRYSSPWAGILHVDIINALGQRVRHFKNITFAKGANQLFWDGKDETGVIINSGIYFVRFTAESSEEFKHRFVGFSKVIFLK